VSQLERDYVPWAYQQGHTTAQIAEHLDRSPATIRRIRQVAEGRLPFPSSSRHPDVPEETVRRIVELVPRIGVRATAAKLGLGIKLVRCRAKKLGLCTPFPNNEQYPSTYQGRDKGGRWSHPDLADLPTPEGDRHAT
jgi:hypothetical protein